MTLLAGDLTTPARFVQWYGNSAVAATPVISQLLTSMSTMIRSSLNRGALYSSSRTKSFNGTGTSMLVLPDYPVTSISALQIGNVAVPAAPLVLAGQPYTGSGWGYRFVPWAGDVPGAPTTLELTGGYFWPGAQNVSVTYQAGYLVASEPWTLSSSLSPANTITVLQQNGIFCRDNGVINVNTGLAMTAIKSGVPTAGQYLPPADTALGQYLFSAADCVSNLPVAISYSFIPANLEEACCQMIAERYVYRGRVGDMSKSLGGQETVRFMRGGIGHGPLSNFPPEVVGLLMPFVSVLPPTLGESQ